MRRRARVLQEVNQNDHESHTTDEDEGDTSSTSDSNSMRRRLEDFKGRSPAVDMVLSMEHEENNHSIKKDVVVSKKEVMGIGNHAIPSGTSPNGSH